MLYSLPEVQKKKKKKFFVCLFVCLFVYLFNLKKCTTIYGNMLHFSNIYIFGLNRVHTTRNIHKNNTQ